MSQVCVKPDDLLTIDGDILIHVNRVCGGCAHLTVDELDDVEVTHCESQKSIEEIRNDLREIAANIVSEVSELDNEASQELLGAFVSELFYEVARKRQHLNNRQRQAEGIAAAKARGVRFGPRRKPLPENFDECRQRWRSGEIKMAEAAEICGMAKSSFYEAAIRTEQSIGCAV